MRPTAVESMVGKLLEGYLQELKSGSAPDREAFLAQHAELADQLAPALDGLEFIHGAERVLSNSATLGSIGAGEMLGDFRLLREVGRGGMGVVYEAEQISLSRRVALKVLPFAGALDQRQRQRFNNEARAAAQLRHAHIVPVYALGCTRGVDYYAMEFIEGQTLGGVIREMKGPRTGAAPSSALTAHSSHRDQPYLRAAAALGRDAALALDHAHELGIIHRDVKPANLLLDGGGKLWVADFGLARSLKDVGLTMSGEIVGTVRYMSPEQAHAQSAPVDHRTDVYSLGATLYEMVTLEAPFPGDDLHLLLNDISTKDPARPRRLNSSIPVDLETIILKAMAKDAAARYATAQELAEDLGRFLSDQPILGRRPSLAEQATRWARCHRGLALAALTIIFVGAVALVIGTKREEMKTKAALDKAHTNLSLAHKAVQEFLTKFGMFRFQDQPTLTPELSALFSQALSFYDVYLSERQDPDAYVDQGYTLYALGRFDDALAAAERALAINPKFVSAHFLRGNALRFRKRSEEALCAYEEALAIDSSDPMLYLQRGVVQKELGRNEAAMADWERALAIDPDLHLAIHNRAIEFMEIGQYDKALDSFDRVIKIAPNFARAHENRSIALNAQKRFEESLVAIDRAIALDPDSANAHRHRSALLAELGRRDEALGAIDRAILLDPSFGRAHYNRSLRLMDVGRREEALEALTRSIEIEPNYGPSRTNRGNLLGDIGHYEEALEEIDYGLKLGGGIQEHYARGGILMKMGRLEEALSAYDQALAIDSTHAFALTNRALTLNQMHRHEEALDSCDRAISFAPNLSNAHLTRSIALFGLKRREDALSAIDRAIALNGSWSPAREMRGDCLLALGRHVEAFVEYERALELGPKSPGLLNKIAWRLVAPKDAKKDQIGRAIELARSAMEGAPRDAAARRTLGVALCRASKWEEAHQALAESMSLSDGGLPIDWLFSAIATHELGRESEARTLYEKAAKSMTATKPSEELRRYWAEAATVLGLR